MGHPQRLGHSEIVAVMESHACHEVIAFRIMAVVQLEVLDPMSRRRKEHTGCFSGGYTVAFDQSTYYRLMDGGDP